MTVDVVGSVFAYAVTVASPAADSFSASEVSFSDLVYTSDLLYVVGRSAESRLIWRFCAAFLVSIWPSTAAAAGFEVLAATLLSCVVKSASLTPALETRVRGETRLVISLLKEREALLKPFHEHVF